MTTLALWTEQWQHFHNEVREQWWGDLTRHTRQSWEDFLGRLSIEARDRALGVREYERSPARTDARKGFYERDVVTRLGTLRVRVARTRQRAFLPAGLGRLERQASEALVFIREAFLRGVSTRAVGRVVALITVERVIAQTVSRVTRDLDQAVARFHQAPLTDDWRLKIDFNEVSDNQYSYDFYDEARWRVEPFLESKAFVTRSFGPSDLATFTGALWTAQDLMNPQNIARTPDMMQRLPDLNLQIRSTQLDDDLPFVGSLGTQYTYFRGWNQAAKIVGIQRLVGNKSFVDTGVDGVPDSQEENAFGQPGLDDPNKGRLPHAHRERARVLSRDRIPGVGL